MRALCVCATACLLAAWPAACDAQGRQPPRCFTDATGDLVGREVHLQDIVLKPGKKKYIQDLKTPLGCDVNGVSVSACDVFAPELDVAEDMSQVEVRRLGPRTFPVQLRVTFFCDPLVEKFINISTPPA